MDVDSSHHHENGKIAVVDGNSKCGIGGCAPKWLSSLSTIKVFTVIVSGVLLFCSAFAYYQSGVVRVVERRFDLSSTQSGLLNSIIETIQVLSGGVIGYIGARTHKPRLIACICFTTVTGIFMQALPYFVFGAKKIDFNVGNDTSISTTFEDKLSLKHPLCGEGDGNYCSMSGEEGGTMIINKYNYESYYSYVIFAIANVIGAQGTSAVYILFVPFVEENTNRGDASVYIGKSIH